MDGVLDFSIGLTEGVAWPWPIAVYLFLAGISGGSLGVILTMMKLRGLSGDLPLLKASSSIALATILLGMLCLVLDLTDPLFFWRILVFYNPTSVMSVSVMMLLFYIPLTAVLTVIVLRHSLKWLPFGLGGLVEKLGDIFNKARGPITWIVLFLAFGICAYTGFLISALIRYPLINTAVLPALFVASGVSAGTAAAKLLATAVFGEKRDSHAMHILHLAEWPMMAAEISCIFMIAMAMIFGMAGAQAAVTAFTTGVWAAVFWVGAVGVGFGVPFALGMTGCTRSAAGFWTAGFAAVAGMMCLRLFILYAGQLNSLMLTPV